MRRTANAQGLDQVAGVSSVGPPVPGLFGRGSLNFGVSRSGVTVRATAIAAAGLARTVGRPNAANSARPARFRRIPPNTANGQLYYVVFGLSQWNSFSTFTISISADGSIKSSDSTTTYGYVADGSAIDTSDVSAAYPSGRPLLGSTAVVGDQANQIPVDPVGLTSELMQEISPTGVTYIPLVEDNASSSFFGRVVGFGYVFGVQQPPGTNWISFSKGGSGTIASQNASATLGTVLSKWFADPSFGSTRTNQLFMSNPPDAIYSPAANNLMLAPALVNRHIANPTNP